MSLYVDIEKQLGSFHLRVQLETENEITALLGASGCGKSMTLKCIAGIVTPDRGRIVLNDRVLFDSEKKVNLTPQQRKLGYLFQNYALFPNMTVEKNILCGVRSKDKQEKAAALADFQGPILWVSHDRGEVFRNCKKVCVMEQGTSQGIVTLRQLFHEPETEAAARLSGCKNIVEALPEGSAVTLPQWGLTLDCTGPVPANIRRVGIRAHHVAAVPEGTPGAFRCTVERVIQDVFTTIVLLRPEQAADDAPPLRMELEREAWQRLDRPESLWVHVQPQDLLLLK